jgi:hypothetical protein
LLSSFLFKSSNFSSLFNLFFSLFVVTF